MKIKVVSKILEANDRIAAENRRSFSEKGIFVVNLMSSPGAGKTTILERTVERLIRDGIRVGVIEGDIAGTADADRLSKFGIPVVQINTGGACHLDANMISEVIAEMPLENINILFIENVGNLVCPAEFNVGEDVKVMILSITEGDDKPLKYPLMFQESSVLLLNKMDIAPYLDVDVQKIKTDVRSLNRGIELIECSAKHGTGLDQWVSWVKSRAGHPGG